MNQPQPYDRKKKVIAILLIAIAAIVFGGLSFVIYLDYKGFISVEKALANNQKLILMIVLIFILYSLFIITAIFIWKKITRISPYKISKFEEESDRKFIELFTNHELALKKFKDVITSEAPIFRVISLHGVGGAGKSWVLRFYTHLCQQNEMVVSLIDCSSIKNAIEILTTIQQDLKRNNIHLPSFNKKLDSYKHIQAKVSNDFQLAETATKVALNVGKQLPVIGTFSELIDSGGLHEEFSLILKKLLSKDEIDLYSKPAEVLTKDFIEDITNVIHQHRIALLFDSYEYISSSDEWLKQFVLQLSNKIIVVIAGQVPISARWQDLRSITDVIEIKALEVVDAKKCLDNYEKQYLQSGLSESEKNEIICFSAGLPIAIGWSVDLMSKYNVRKFSEVRNEVIGNLVETMISAAPDEMRMIIETCAIPRWFNEDTLRYLLPSHDARDDYIMLYKLPIVRPRPEGLALHDRVRNFIIENMKQRSIQYYIDINNKCIDYYQNIIDKINFSTKDKLLIEIIYHKFNINNEDGFEILSNSINRALITSDLMHCDSLLAEVYFYNLDLGKNKWVEYWKGELEYRRGYWFNSLNILIKLYESINDEEQVLIPTCTTLGRIYYQQGDLCRSKHMFQKSLIGMDKNNKFKMKGYVTEQLAKVFRMEGNLKDAIKLHETAVEYANQFDDDYEICSGAGSHGTTLILAGRLREGIGLLLQSINHARRLGYTQFICTGLRSRAVGLMFLGQFKTAESSGAESLLIAEKLGDVYNQGFARLALGQIFIEKKCSPELIFSTLDQAINDLDTVGAKFDLGNAFVAMACFYKMQGEFEKAFVFFDKAFELLSPLSFKYGLGWLYYYRGRTYFEDDNTLKAYSDLTIASNIADSLDSLYLGSRVKLELSKLAFLADDPDGFFSLLACTIDIAEQNKFYDILSKAEFLKGSCAVKFNLSFEEVFDCFFQSLINAIQYNIYLFDRTAKQIKDLCNKDQQQESTACKRLKILSEKWLSNDNNGKSWHDFEINKRQNETGEAFSSLQKLFFGTDTIH